MFGLRTKTRWMLVGLVAGGGLVLSTLWVDYSVSAHTEGLYLLRGDHGKLLTLANDLYLGEEELLIAGIDFARSSPVPATPADPAPHLDLEWSSAAGYGQVRNYLGSGRWLVTNFSRYRDSDDRHPHGLFIGGGEPAAVRNETAANRNDTGMTYFDGTTWRHVWCNTNEGIGSTVTPKRHGPSSWTFLGSGVVRATPQELVLGSSHRLELDGVPLHIERTTRFTAGDPSLQLTITIANLGRSPSHYYYFYGDEPWVGNFGSAAGDVGWAENRIYQDEALLDPRRVAYAGMADFGNDVIGEGHGFTRIANFIEWLGPDRPDVVFFANRYDGFSHDPSLHVPLRGDGRSIGMYWGPRQLAPGESRTMTLAIGMAGVDARSGLPTKPSRRAAVAGAAGAVF